MNKVTFGLLILVIALTSSTSYFAYRFSKTNQPCIPKDCPGICGSGNSCLPKGYTAPCGSGESCSKPADIEPYGDAWPMLGALCKSDSNCGGTEHIFCNTKTNKCELNLCPKIPTNSKDCSYFNSKSECVTSYSGSMSEITPTSNSTPCSETTPCYAAIGTNSCTWDASTSKCSQNHNVKSTTCAFNRCTGKDSDGNIGKCAGNNQTN